MSLPSGLLFYLDYTYGSDVGGQSVGNASNLYPEGSSIYNNPTGKDIQSGSLGTGGQYDLLGSGYSRVHTSKDFGAVATAAKPTTGQVGFIDTIDKDTGVASYSISNLTGNVGATLAGAAAALIDFDQAVIDYCSANTKVLGFALVLATDLVDADGLSADLTLMQDIVLLSDDDNVFSTTGAVAASTALQPGENLVSLRRHTKRVDINGSNVITVNPLGGTHILLPYIATAGLNLSTANSGGAIDHLYVSFPVAATLDTSDASGSA